MSKLKQQWLEEYRQCYLRDLSDTRLHLFLGRLPYTVLSGKIIAFSCWSLSASLSMNVRS
ncbi:MAG: hypothetical protein ACTS73_04455 [Arsenophonus sp. NEOnobi-MAG3]